LARNACSAPQSGAIAAGKLAADLEEVEEVEEVVDFYNERFSAGIAGRDREDLIAFLRAL